MMVIGAELESMIEYTSRWRKVIRVIRARFPGRLTYSSNQVEGARRVEFWRQLDYVGMTGYMPLARGRNPSVTRLVRTWKDRGYVRGARRLHRRYRKPVMFTEVGYGSWKGTAARPWASVDGPISQVPQHRAYQALYRRVVGARLVSRPLLVALGRCSTRPARRFAQPARQAR